MNTGRTFLDPQAVFASTPLKEMESAMLTMTFMNGVQSTLHPATAARVLDAMQVAALLHKGQTRKNRADLPVTPYIEHPLRNAIRLQRLGVTDPSVLIAALLHDTVEDCLAKLLLIYCAVDADSMSLQEARELAYEWIAERFDIVASNIVRNVTNDPAPDGTTKVEKRALYRKHTTKSIRKDLQTFLVKFVDFKDNAASLIYIVDAKNSAMVASMASKYLPMVDEFRFALDLHRGELDDAEVKSILASLDSIERQLKGLLDK